MHCSRHARSFTATSARWPNLPARPNRATGAKRRRRRWRAAGEQGAPLYGLVFCTTLGKPLAPDRVTPQWRAVLARLGLPRIRIHDLRHTAASLLLQWGTHPKVVQELLGHSTIAITLDLYSHTVPALHRQAAQQFDQLFRASTSSTDAAQGAAAPGE